jgi:hypothetical protein
MQASSSRGRLVAGIARCRVFTIRRAVVAPLWRRLRHHRLAVTGALSFYSSLQPVLCDPHCVRSVPQPQQKCHRCTPSRTFERVAPAWDGRSGVAPGQS